MAFEINGSQPPNGARPISNHYRFSLPESRFNSGQGIPIANAGRASLTVSLPKLKVTGWDWWVAFMGDEPSVAISSVQFYNPYKSGGADWDTWTGGAILHRPSFERLKQGVFEDVEIMITEMVEA